MNTFWTLYFDGGCQPRNPGGYATYGWCLLTPDGDEHSFGKGVACNGPGATNNVAEYAALEAGLRYITGKGLWDRISLRMRGDSKLVVMTVIGKWRCKKPHLQKYLQRIQRLLAGRTWEIGWIPREENQRADGLSNRAYAQHCKKIGIEAVPFRRPYQ